MQTVAQALTEIYGVLEEITGGIRFETGDLYEGVRETFLKDVDKPTIMLDVSSTRRFGYYVTVATKNHHLQNPNPLSIFNIDKVRLLIEIEIDGRKLLRRNTYHTLGDQEILNLPVVIDENNLVGVMMESNGISFAPTSKLFLLAKQDGKISAL